MINQKPMRVGVGLPQSWVLALMFILAIYMQAVGTPILYVIMMICFDMLIVRWLRVGSRQLYFFCGLVLYLLGWNFVFPLAFHLIVLYDRKMLRDDMMDEHLTIFIEWLSKFETPMTNPFTGNNGTVSNIVESIFNTLRVNYHCGTVVEMERLRDLDVSQAPLELAQKIEMDVNEVLDRYNHLSTQWKLAVYVFMLICTVTTVGWFGAVALFFLYNVATMTESEIRTQIFAKNKTAPMKGGVYRIVTKTCGFKTRSGIGVVYDGVLHVPYHVCFGNSIDRNGREIAPYFIDVNDDIVTYGGPPKFSKVQEDDEVYVNTETDESRTSYRIKDLAVGEDTTTLGWKGVTKPGESGSPVISLRGEEKNVILVGQAGRYVRNRVETTEFSTVKGYTDQNNITKIVSYPGSGKTRQDIPRQLRLYEGLGTTMTLGWSRVICFGIYLGVTALGHKVSYEVQGSLHRGNSNNIITTHASGTKKLLTGDRRLVNLVVIIIDEAHVMDPATIMLRQYCKSLAANGIKIIEMSATLDGQVDDRSNYDILEKELDREEDMYLEIYEKLNEGKRVMVFVTSLDNKMSKRLQAEHRLRRPVMLSRKTFESGMKGVEDTTRTLIITTEIAECGINVPELDVVVDVNSKYGYVYEMGAIMPTVYKVNKASRVQRRGRVGRTKPGEYIYLKSQLREDVVTAQEFDAQVLMTGREWYDGNNDWRITLSDKQLLYWLKEDNDETPLQIYLGRDKNGLRYSRNETRKRVAEIRGEGFNITHCNVFRCPCLGKWKMFDMRCHDWLVKLETD